jgi:hypothetical protein
MGEPDTTAHGLASLIGELNEEYEDKFGDKLIAEDDGSLTGYKFAHDEREYDTTSDINDITEHLVSNGDTLLLLDQYASDQLNVHEYSFGDTWDLSTLSYDNESFDTGGFMTEPAGIDTDGETLLICGSDNDRIYRYNFGSSWDVSTLSGPDGNFNDLDQQDTAPRGITTNGFTLIMAGSSTDSLYQYSFGTDWDPSTLTYDNISYDISGETTSVKGLHSDGEYLILKDGDNNNIAQYTFDTDWNLPSLSHYVETDGTPSESTRGVVSGGGVVILSDAGDEKLYSYSYVPEIRLPER